MNNRPVEQALATLLPTHANELPPELVTLAQSLIAQSRSYASSLKPEEEIARPFACAEIACRRLSRLLKLPPLLGRPPCPPRVYKKLYTFLDNSIGTNKANPKKEGTAKGLNRTPSKSTPRRNTPLKDTPSRTASVKRARFMHNPTQSSQNINDAPEWVMPSIRTVCKTLSTPAPRMSLWSRPPISRSLPPHIFAGVSSILHFITAMPDKEFDKLDEDASEFLEIFRTPSNKSTDDYKELVNALIVAIYFLVLARRRSPGPGAENNGSANPGREEESRKMDKKTFSEMRQTALSSLGLSPTEKRHGEDVDAWIAVVMGQKWAKSQEWFENIPLAGERDEEFVDGHVLEDEDNTDLTNAKRRKTKLLVQTGNREGLLLPGLGTMMQDRVDYLSEDRREDYAEWKTEIMKRIASMEKSASSDVSGKKRAAVAVA
ncbi:origin recognition complex, subunit 6 [Talaromyces proteolyticus]|uniref:Origin recognition complex, subunit 6 n=1 Tax=Talaromyces proteolyticus TaxID=1131652 RepID=A0AAD4KUK1_9EURO|nr:origin recognition complex, subunit 6 [Talaromyces proteolyticus]KAH8696329.1 origin recognition complex, subunit 6 [Talaromyces proteolyticus]